MEKNEKGNNVNIYNIDNKKTYNIITNISIRKGIAPLLVATGALIAALGYKGATNTTQATQQVIETTTNEDTTNTLIDDNITTVDYETNHNIVTVYYNQDYDTDITELTLSEDVEERAEYLCKTFKEYGIINKQTKRYYTKQEIIDLINFVNGNGEYDVIEANNMYDETTNLPANIGSAKNYVNTVNNYCDPKFNLDSKPYNIHMAEAIIDNKESNTYQLFLYLDNLHREIINTKEESKRTTLIRKYDRIMVSLLSGDYMYNNEHYSIKDFDLSEKYLLDYYAGTLIPFDFDNILSAAFNTHIGYGFIGDLEKELIESNTTKKVEIKF